MKINPTWKRIYYQILENQKDSFPANFWRHKVEEKSRQLLKHYALKNNISPKFISYRDPETIIQSAKLEEPVTKVYSGQPELLLVRTFSEVTLDDFQWNNSRKPTPEEVEKFRKHYCTWKEIGNYYGIQPEEIQKIVKNIPDLPEQQENSFINAPVLEIELFWNLVEKVQKSCITLEELFKIMEIESGWKKTRINKYLCQYSIKSEIGRYNTNRRKIEEINNLRRLNKTEKLVVNDLRREKILRLKSYGADFLFRDSIAIEVKKTLNSQNAKIAALQLNYAADTLGARLEKRIYTEKISDEKYALSGAKRIFAFYDIDIYVYSSDRDKFVKKDIE